MGKRKSKIFDQILTWREKHLSEQQFVIVLAFVTGLLGATAALILKFLIHQFQHWLTYSFTDGANYLYLLYPVASISLACCEISACIISLLLCPTYSANS